MKYATYLALIGAASANTQLTIDIDDAALQQTGMDVANRVQEWAGENQANIMDLADKLEELTNETLTRGAATDNERAEALVAFIDATVQAAFPDSSVCDEQAFADCLLAGGNEVEWDRLDHFDSIFQTTCAAVNNCTSPCLSPNYRATYDFEYGTAEYDAAYAVYEADRQICRDAEVPMDAAADDFESSMNAFAQQMEELWQTGFMEKQAELETLAQSFATLSDGLLGDFGCQESCFEDCFMTAFANGEALAQADAEDNCQWYVENYPEYYTSMEACLEEMPAYEAEYYVDQTEAPMCAVTTCCDAVQAVTFGVTQTNIECQFNDAKNVQCYTADL